MHISMIGFESYIMYNCVDCRTINFTIPDDESGTNANKHTLKRRTKSITKAANAF